MICQRVAHVFYHNECFLEDQRKACLGFCPGGKRENFKAVIAAI